MSGLGERGQSETSAMTEDQESACMNLLRCCAVCATIATGAGCTLGHIQFKTTLDPLEALGGCHAYDEVFDAKDYDKGRVEVLDRSAALISNVCVDDAKAQRMSLAVIEFDDEGNHWKREQFLNAVDEIADVSSDMTGVGTAPRTDGLFMVVYVHGWRSNASEDRDALARFRWFVTELARSDDLCLQAGPEPSEGGAEGEDAPCAVRPHVYGVYVAWRGDAVGNRLGSLPIAEYLTFWNRKAAAKRVAGTAMTETLLGLFDALETADRSRFQQRKDQAGSELTALTAPPRSRSLVIGHSMGARILEYAFAQAFLAKRLEARRSYGRRLLATLSTLGSEANALDQSRDQHRELRDEITAADAAIRLMNEQIADDKAALGELDDALENPVSAEDKDQVLAFVNLQKPEPRDTPSGCATYSARRVDTCMNQSQDLRLLAHCAEQEVECIYRSYRCSIDKLIAASSPDQPSPECSGAIQLQAEVATEEEIETWQKFADDVTDEADELRGKLEDPWQHERGEAELAKSTDDIPDNERVFEWALELGDSLADWRADVKPFYFAPGGPQWLIKDATTNDELMLLESLQLAKDDVQPRLARSRTHLADVGSIWDAIREERKLTDDRKKLVDKLPKQKTARDGAEDARDQLREARDVEACRVADLEESVAELSRDVPYELDGALHPPGDVVLLLNAATEALSARNLIHAMRLTRGKTADTMQRVHKILPRSDTHVLRRPWIVSATAEGDNATRMLFPWGVRWGRLIGRAASRKFQDSHAECEEQFGDFGDLVAKTTGHHDDLLSHVVVALKDDGEDGDVVFEANGEKWAMRELPTQRCIRNYWVTRVPPEVIEGHGDVLTEETLALTKGLLAFNGVFVSWCPRFNQQSGKCETEKDAAGSGAPADRVQPEPTTAVRPQPAKDLDCESLGATE